MALERVKGRASRFGAYLDALPQRFSTPLWMSEDELATLRSTRVNASAQQERAALQSLCTVAGPQLLAALRKQTPAPHLPSMLQLAREALTRDGLLWARTIVFSRAFTLLLGGKPAIALVPVFDLLDHDPTARVAWIMNDAEGKVELVADAPVASGARAWNNYGPKPNEELLQGYGFSLLGNAADRFHVRLALGETGACGPSEPEPGGDAAGGAPAVSRKALLRRLGVSLEHKLRLADPMPGTLLEAARLCMMPDDAAYECETSVIYSRGTPQPPPTAARARAAPPPSLALECKVLATLRQLLRAALAGFAGGDLAQERRLLRAAAKARGSEPWASALATGGGAEAQEEGPALVGTPADSVAEGGALSDAELFCVIYRLGQKEIACAALDAIALRAATLLATPAPDLLSRCRDKKVMPGGDNVAAAFHDGYPTLYVVADCQAGEIIARAPLHDVLWLDRAGLLKAQAYGVDPQVLLALSLLANVPQQPGVLIRPVEHQVPALHCTIPLASPISATMCFENEAAAVLEGTALGDDLDEQNAELQSLFETKILPSMAGLLAGPPGGAPPPPPALGSSFTSFRRSLAVASHAARAAALRSAAPPASGEDPDLSTPEADAATLAVSPLLCSVAPALLGVLLEVVVDVADSEMQLRALTALKAGSLLSNCLAGLDNGSRLVLGGAGAELLDNPADSVEVCLGPPEDDSSGRAKEELLAATGLGSVHHLTLPPRPERVLAAVAVCSLDSDEELRSAGAPLLLEAYRAAQQAARAEETENGSDATGCHAPKVADALKASVQRAEEELAEQRRSFVADVLLTKKRRKDSRAALRRLLRAARRAIQGDSAERDLALVLQVSARLESAATAKEAGVAKSPEADSKAADENLSRDGSLGLEATAPDTATYPVQNLLHPQGGCGEQTTRLRCLRAALVYRHGQKRVLDGWLDALKAQKTS